MCSTFRMQIKSWTYPYDDSWQCLQVCALYMWVSVILQVMFVATIFQHLTRYSPRMFMQGCFAKWDASKTAGECRDTSIGLMSDDVNMKRLQAPILQGHKCLIWWIRKPSLDAWIRWRIRYLDVTRYWEVHGDMKSFVQPKSLAAHCRILEQVP